ncbi:MAG: single-stranded-DNA-specific exonuclease RecJ [Thiovulaceae bacterium]|nr:single-stranded-DNA-specific exonuclease RecJ [Sulfurimonadaceae bacterium]
MANDLKLTPEKIHQKLRERFDGDFKRLSDIPDPALLHDGLIAAKRIAHAITNNQSITVVGDYDVDGVTSTSIMIDFFKIINYPLKTIIPNRFTDGYGISKNIMQRVEADLVITVDNGINAIEAAQICRERNIDLIITDHHTPSDTLPQCFALVNPKLKACTYPFKEICGAQVAWLLLALVKKELNADVNMSSFLDLLCIAIIADVMPLTNINRVMVQKGLELIPKSPRPSMMALCSYLNKERMSAEDIGFQIAPRINSAGRMEDASYALAFLTASTEMEAFQALEKLDRLNTFRKDIEASATKEAFEQANSDDKIIVVAQENWHEGVVGIVAARLVGRFEKPAIVLSNDNGIAKGSARSLGEVNLYDLLSQSSSHLLKFGGHKMAAGLALDITQVDAFRKTINAHADKLKASDFIPEDEIMGELESEQINFDLLKILDQFEPFGEGNPRPKFLIKDTPVLYVKRFGENNAHLRFNVPHKNEPYGLGVVAFKNSTLLENNSKVSLSFTLNKNEYNGKVSIQLMLDRFY